MNEQVEISHERTSAAIVCQFVPGPVRAVLRSACFASWLLASFTLTLGCDDNAGPGTDAGVPLEAGTFDALDAPSGVDTRTTMPVWPEDATVLDATEGLGYGPGPSPACEAPNRYTYTRTTRMFTWDRCITPVDAARMQGARTLPAAQEASLMAALAGVTIAPTGTCGADKGLLQFSVTTPKQQQHYVDSFYRCSGDPGVIYVDGINELFRVLEGFAMPVSNPDGGSDAGAVDAQQSDA